MPVLRRAARSDVAAILNWFGLPYAAPFLRRPSPENIEAALEHANKALFMVEDHGQRVAHFALFDVGDPSGIVNLGIVVVAKPRRGYGRFAVRAAQRFAFVDCCAHRLWLEVTSDNIAARCLYETCGFVHEGTWRDGFPADDGNFKDLAAYGMLASEYDENSG
ncbi:MAG: GNAT family N-acetyltransferase [Candidatus Eremiobacteraeota bacterium]|nr:GNAT family N-acetyltransferase [Candidatus Eremiobacteraeota bacterium]